MKELNVKQMERISGGDTIPQGLTCALAVVATVGLFGSIFAGNIFGIITGPTAAGVAIASCVTGG